MAALRHHVTHLPLRVDSTYRDHGKSTLDAGRITGIGLTEGARGANGVLDGGGASARSLDGGRDRRGRGARAGRPDVHRRDPVRLRRVARADPGAAAGLGPGAAPSSVGCGSCSCTGPEADVVEAVASLDTGELSMTARPRRPARPAVRGVVRRHRGRAGERPVAGRHAQARHRGPRDRADRPVAGGVLRTWPTRRDAGSVGACPTCATRPTTTATPTPSKESSSSSTWRAARCSRSSTPGSCRIPTECGNYYPESSPSPRGSEAHRDHPARGPELLGGRQPRPLAEVVPAGVHGLGRGPRPPRGRLRGRGTCPSHPLPGLGQRDGGSLRGSRPHARLEERLRRRRMGTGADVQLAHPRVRLSRRHPLLRRRLHL